MLGPLRYPAGIIAVEKRIVHGRRADIIVYSREFTPLLLIECKADCLEEEVAFRQATGYNGALAAPFWAVAHDKGCRMFWMEGERICSIPFLPPYHQLQKRE
jgi:hypothetical protein